MRITHNSKLKIQHSTLRKAHNSTLKTQHCQRQPFNTQHSTLRIVHNSKFLIEQFLMRKAHNSKFKIQNSKFLNPGQYGFCGSRSQCPTINALG